MIVGIGVDMIERSRVERESGKGAWTPGDGVYTAEELQNYSGRLSQQLLCESFTAKEAVLKALGAEVTDLGIFREVEVLYGTSGSASIVLHARLQSKAQGLGVRRVWVSTASRRKHAGAMVVLES